MEAKKVQKKPALQKQPLREERKDRFLDEHEDWIKKKLNAIGHNLDMSNKSNGICLSAYHHVYVASSGPLKQRRNVLLLNEL